MSQQPQKWYGVKLLYLFEVHGIPDRTLLDNDYIDNYKAFEESVLVVLADSFEAAYDKAKRIARDAEDTYTNLYEQQVQKTFYDFIDCYLIDDADEVSLTHGVEVYSDLKPIGADLTPAQFMQLHWPLDNSVVVMLLNKDLPLS